MDILITVLGCGLACLASYCIISCFFNRKLTWTFAHCPADVNPEEWESAVCKSGPGASLIGRLETLFVFLAVVLAKEEAGPIVGGWFVFKVATKWEIWTNIVKMPESITGIADLELLRARRTLGSIMYDRFLIGTLVNVLIGAIVGVVVLKVTAR